MGFKPQYFPKSMVEQIIKMIDQKIKMECNLGNNTDIRLIDDGFVFVPSIDGVSFLFFLFSLSTNHWDQGTLDYVCISTREETQIQELVDRCSRGLYQERGPLCDFWIFLPVAHLQKHSATRQSRNKDGQVSEQRNWKI